MTDKNKVNITKKPTQAKKKRAKLVRDTASQQRFLNAAEYLFAEHGYEGALHHYWGNKEELFSAVCQRRLSSMNNERMQRLDDLVSQAGDGEIDIRGLFRASIEPTFFLHNLNTDEQQIFRKFYGRAMTEPSPLVGKVMREIFTPVSLRFFSLLKGICPHLTDDEFYWRANCIFGAYLYVPAFSERMRYYAHPEFNPNDTEQSITQTVEFLVAGIMAPSTPTP